MLVDGQPADVHFGPEFPGDALVLYRRFLAASLRDGVVAGTYVVVDVVQGEAVGQVGTIGPPDAPRVEIGYGINRSARGRGIASAALAALLAILGADASAATVFARTDPANTASIRVLRRNGFAVVGREAGPDGEVLVWELRS